MTHHPTALVADSALVEERVELGPYAVVGDDVRLGPECRVGAHAVVSGPSRFGARNRLAAHAVIGAAPQDRSYDDEATILEIGDDNEFREHCTVHRGTAKGGGKTVIGSRCLFMVGSHVAHDCTIGDDVTLTNLATLGGHVTLEDGVVLGGHVAVAPFVRIGSLAFAAGGAMIERDVPPYVIVGGDRARVRGINRVGLERAGVPLKSRDALRRAYKTVYLSHDALDSAVQNAAAALGDMALDPYVVRFLKALARPSER